MSRPRVTRATISGGPKRTAKVAMGSASSVSPITDTVPPIHEEKAAMPRPDRLCPAWAIS
jgi:hypothetical protein